MYLKKLKTKVNLELSSVTDIYKVSELKELLLEGSKTRLPLNINGSKVERIDTVSCQLLVAAKNFYEENDLAFNINASDKMMESINLIGLSDVLEVKQ